MHVTERFVFDDDTREVITTLEATGFSHVGTTTYRGCVEELDFFNKAGMHVNLSFRHMPEGTKPIRPLED